MLSVMAKDCANVISTEECRMYDRQIRLWGHDAQNKLRTAKVLLIGMQGLGAEIAKNLILSGVNSITLKDHTSVCILDYCSQFLIPLDSVERNRAKASLSNAQKLNPNVKVLADTTPIEENTDGFFSSFDIIIATECSPTTYKRLNNVCRRAKKKLIIADVFGLFGYFFQDINFEHSMFDKVFPNNDDIIDPVTKFQGQPLSYILASALLKFQMDGNRKPNPDSCEEDTVELKSTIHNFIDHEKIKPEMFDEYYSELFGELSPATSTIGGIVTQIALSIIMGTETYKTFKNYNVFFYDHIIQDGKFILM